MRHSPTLCFAITILISSCAAVQPQGPVDHAPEGERDLAAQIVDEFLFAWDAYRTNAWGHDGVMPISGRPHDWYDHSLLITPVDALDTMILMGLDEEADEAREYIALHLSFDHDMYVKNFEITIRVLGGLLSAFQLTDDHRLLELAQDLAERLLPAFASPTGMPYVDVNLRTGGVRGHVSNPAEIGTLIVEFGTLSKLSGDPKYFDAAKAALVALYERRSDVGLVGQAIDVISGEWTNPSSHIGAGIDSYYEYLLKCALLFDDADCGRMWNESIVALNRHLADSTESGFWYGHADMHTAARTRTLYGALEGFFPAVLALSGDLERASRLQQSGFDMWTLFGAAPERFDYVTLQPQSPRFFLNPEIAESAYYLYQYTGDPVYREMGSTIFRDLKTCCRTSAGYAALESVLTGEQTDRMESYFFSETLMYLYLLAAEPDRLDFSSLIFTTNGHPLRRTW